MQTERAGTTGVLLIVAIAACSSRGGEPSPSKQARQELATFLRAIDHEQDLFWDRFAGRLVERADLGPSPLVMHRHGVVAVGPAEVTLNDQAVDVPTLRARLAEQRAQAAEAEPRLWFAIAPDVAWKQVAEIVTTAADAGYAEALFLFDRRPATPPPPRSAIDDQFHALRARGAGGELAPFLAKTRQRLLAGCRELDAVFVADPGGDDVAGALLERLAAAIETSTCTFDLPAVRSLIWLTTGNPYPHGVVAVPLGAGATTLALPANLPWRDASARIVPGMPAVRFVAE